MCWCFLRRLGPSTDSESPHSPDAVLRYVFAPDCVCAGVSCFDGATHNNLTFWNLKLKDKKKKLEAMRGPFGGLLQPVHGHCTSICWQASSTPVRALWEVPTFVPLSLLADCLCQRSHGSRAVCDRCVVGVDHGKPPSSTSCAFLVADSIPLRTASDAAQIPASKASSMWAGRSWREQARVGHRQ